MITLTIDGQPVSVEPHATVMEAALRNGIDIPRLCYHPELHPSGGCRLCMVEVEGRPMPEASCGLQCADGMVVRTRSDQLTTLRRDIVDLFVSDHPLRCVTCDKSGACELQHYAYEYGVSETSYTFELSRTLYQDDNPFFIRDHEMCIMCGRCTRVCDEIVGANAIELVGRGFATHVATPFDGPLIDSSCVQCGSCVQVCPTAALLPVSRLGQGREWELERKRTTCGFCGVGCGVEFRTKQNTIVYAQGYPEAPANGEWLCAKGRFGWDWVDSPERLTQPLIRRDLAHELGLIAEPWTLPDTSALELKGSAHFVPVSWEQALDVVVTKLADAVGRQGPDCVAGLASARCTNEENYLFQKLMRATVGTNNVDHCARLCHASTVAGLGMAFGSGAMTNPIEDVRNADCLVITGSNTAESHPVIGYDVVRAVKSGANLVVIDPRRVPLVDHATLHLQPTPGSDSYVFLAMAHVIVREGWADPTFVADRTEGFEAWAASVAAYTPELAALHSGVPAELIERATRMYALGERARGVSRFDGERGHASILYAMGITQRSNGTKLVLMLANLALLTGQIGKPATGINPLRGQANVQGACDVAALPNVLPGYQAVTDDETRTAVAQRWSAPDLPAKPGLTVVEMMQAAASKRLAAMYIMGENPMLSDPNIQDVEQGLRALDFLVVQDVFMSETAQLAHVVLPAAASLEKDGSFTNTERRVQLIAPVVLPPGAAQPDWQIICALGQRLDARLGKADAAERWRFEGTAAIMDEIAAVTPIYGGIRHARLDGAGIHWPCPTDTHPGTPILHVGRFSRGLGRFHAVTAREPAEQPDAEFPLLLTTGRVLHQYHTGTMTRRSAPLDWREPHGYAEISAADAAQIGLGDGDTVVIASRRGQVQVQGRVSQRVEPGTVFLSFHWNEAPANLLTQDTVLDPIAKIPEYKVTAVRIAVPRAAADEHHDPPEVKPDTAAGGRRAA